MQNTQMSSPESQQLAANIRDMFDNSNPVDVWHKASQLVKSINPLIDLTSTRHIFDDVLRLFDGSYPGYGRIQTPYHDLRHTLDVFMCAARILHGVHLSKTPLNDEEITLIMVAALLHDIGYAQTTADQAGTGAQHTRTHILRGITFMEQHLDTWQLPSSLKPGLAAIIRCTDLGHHLSQIDFPSPRIRLLGEIVASADLVGQMADRTYLEKLLFLYLEFKEADLGNYENSHEMLQKTRHFYELIRATLDEELNGVFHLLTYHFKNWTGIERNFYEESIERNIEYLDTVVALHQDEWLSMLKRHGITKTFEQINTNALSPR